jgi:hypothetical protein
MDIQAQEVIDELRQEISALHLQLTIANITNRKLEALIPVTHENSEPANDESA